MECCMLIMHSSLVRTAAVFIMHTANLEIQYIHSVGLCTERRISFVPSSRHQCATPPVCIYRRSVCRSCVSPPSAGYGQGEYLLHCDFMCKRGTCLRIYSWHVNSFSLIADDFIVTECGDSSKRRQHHIDRSLVCTLLTMH